MKFMWIFDVQLNAMGFDSCFTAQVRRYPAGYTQFLSAASRLLEPSRELVIVGDPAQQQTQALLKVFQPRYLPDVSLVVKSPEAEQKRQVSGQATAYQCQNFACQKPQPAADGLRKILFP